MFPLLAHVQVHVRPRKRLGPRVHVADWAGLFVQNEFAALGTDVLTACAATELGLEPHTPVGSGVIDACTEFPSHLYAHIAESG